MCQTIAQVMETSATSADYLKYRYIQEAAALGAEMSLWGKAILDLYEATETNRWAYGPNLSDDLESLCNQMESDLSTLDADYVTYWDGGFTILTPCHNEACPMRGE